MDREELISPDGIPKLVAAINIMIQGKRNQEAKELHREGGKQGGLLSRQVGEPMGSYCGRRKRWHKRLKGLDDGFAVSEKIQADMLLEQAGISQDQQLMVLTSTGNVYSYEKISEVLNEHHSKLHEKEKRSAHGGGSETASGFSKPGRTGAVRLGPVHSSRCGNGAEPSTQL